MPTFYADSSALVKLVKEEPESSALRKYLADADLVSSELILTEMSRAAHRAAVQGPKQQLDLLLERTGAIIDIVALRPLDRDLLRGAGALGEPSLRSLDAIHIASAISLAPAVDTFITYDERQSAAARLAGLRTISPALP